MRRLCLFLLLSSLVAAQGFILESSALAAGPGKEVERPDKASEVPIFIISATSREGRLAVAAGVNCRWLCGEGGSGEADVSSPLNCAAACEAACDTCRKVTYIASAGELIFY